MKDPKEVLDEYGKLEERNRLARVQYFSVSLFVFRKNAQELRELIEWAESPENCFKLWDVRNRADLDRFILELICKVHNFVAAANSLVDHSRNFYRKNYEPAGEFKDYEAEVRQRFVGNKLVQFVQDLRNYCLHHGPPPVNSVLSYSESVGSAHKICMNREVLLKFRKWSGPSKHYLNAVSGRVDLYEVVCEYEKQVNEFYQWVDSRLREIHAKDYEIVQEKKAEVLAALEKLSRPSS